jgi:PAS domain S-box-containing protein
MPDSLVLSDLKGKILKANRAMINFLDYSEPELIGKCVSELFIDKNFGETILSELKGSEKLVMWKQSLKQNVEKKNLSCFQLQL